VVKSRIGAHALLIVAAAFTVMPTLLAQTTPPASAAESSTLDDTMTASEADAPSARKLVKWNELDGKYATARVGGGFLYEFNAYAQNEESKQQFAMHPQEKVRDFRILLGGRFKFFKRSVTYQFGYMYDAALGEWRVRQSGIMVDVPELLGSIFVGRTKEGFSLNKVMVGYAGWSMERFTMNDAMIPILADGVKWLGSDKKHHMLWNLGIYKDWISQKESFSTYDHQVVGRVAWLPEMSDADKTVLHIGLSVRYGVPKDHRIQPRSRPESFTAPYFLDTGKFTANNTRMLGPEVYYRPGSVLIGSEYFFQKVDAPQSGNPLFHGGDVFVSWLPTGEVRTYNTRGGYFNGIVPNHSLFSGGRGAWELVGRFSYTDLDGGTLKGGKFWRITPMVNWHMSPNMRLEMVYGYGSLDKFNITGGTQFFQTRIQFQL
jgi:phosphate-selective porin OprO/OprP